MNHQKPDKKGFISLIRRRPYRTATIVFSVLIATVIGLFAIFDGGSKSQRITEVVTRGDLVQEVSVIGRVQAAQDIDLAFERSGRVSRIPVAVGQKVPVGTALVWLSAGDLVAQRNEATAELAAQEADLEVLRVGAQKEELRVQEAKLREAEQELANLYAGSPDVLIDTFVKADDAVRNRTDDIFTNDTSDTPDLTFTTNNFQTTIAVENSRKAVTGHLAALEEYSRISSRTSGDEIGEALTDAQDRLLAIRDFLTLALTAVDQSTGLTQSTISSYKDDLNTARTNVSTAISNVGTRLQNIAAKELAVERASQELALLEAGSSAQEIAAQEARVRRAEAQLARANAELAKAVVRAPFAGTVTTIAVDVGELVVPDIPAVTLISEENLEIEAFIPEVDVAEVSVDDTAAVTLDSFGADVVFGASVVSVDPAETIRDGVATYKTLLHFTQQDERIRPGMTANIDIVTARRSDSLAVPFRAVIRQDGTTFVRVITGNGIQERAVETGIRTIEGQVEITSGLKEGDEVLVFER